MKWCLNLSLLSSIVQVVHAAAQQPFASSVPYDDGLFTPFENLHALSVSEYTTLRHPQFPAHSVRIKESRFCDGEVRQVLVYALLRTTSS